MANIPGHGQPEPTAQQKSAPTVATVGNPGGRIQGGSILLFRVAGIDVLLHWSWFLIAYLRLQSTGAGDSVTFTRYQSQAWYVVEYLALFGIVLLHEFGHVLACRSVGGIANRIVLWPFGGIAFVDPPPRPGAFLWSIAAGPLVNVLLLFPTLGFMFTCRLAGLDATAPDIARLAGSLAWMNAYLLLFNLLPVYPLDGGRILQALLWFVLGRARSLLAATAVGLVTALGLLVLAIAVRSTTWIIVAGLAILFSFVGFRSAKALLRALAAPRRQGVACPDCGAAPPTGRIWNCPRCYAQFDVFEANGICPNCSTPLAAVLCPDCGRARPYAAWCAEVVTLEPPEGAPQAAPVLAEPKPQRPTAPPSAPTTRQRLVWAAVFAAFALCLCGLPGAEQQPLGLVVWTIGGALLGASSAGFLSRNWSISQARKKLRGTWRLIEEDGRAPTDDANLSRRLILNNLVYEERIGNQLAVRGACWIDPAVEPSAISFTPKTGPDAGRPQQGIYRVEGKNLTICLASLGRMRPTEFISQPDVQQVRVYLRTNKKGD